MRTLPLLLLVAGPALAAWQDPIPATATTGIAAIPHSPAATAAPFVAVADPDRRSLATATELAAGAATGLPLIDRPTADGAVWFTGHGFKGSVDGAAFTFVPFLGADAPRNFPVELRLKSVRVGTAAVPLTAGAVRINGQRVEVPRAGCVEYYDIERGSVEQSFRFDQLPGRGRLDLEFALATELRPEPWRDGLRFVHEHGSVTYTDGVATDGNGDRCPVAIELAGTTVRLSVPAAFVEHAALPLVVDPRLVGNTIAQTTPRMIDPDCAWNAQSGEYMAVWAQPFSSTDWDIYAQRFQQSMLPVGALQAIDVSSLSWQFPRVAARRITDQFLVVAQSSSGAVAPFWIAGRLVAGTASGAGLGSQFNIERSGFVGLSGNNFRPDVGGDQYNAGSGVFFFVVWEHETTASNHDIHYRRIDMAGTFPSGMPYVLSARPANESNPAISATNGDGLTTIPLFAVVWQETASPGNEDIMAATLNLGGSILAPPFYLNTSLINTVKPRVSSYSHPLNGTTGRAFMAVYENGPDYFGLTGQVGASVFSGNALLRNFVLSNLDGTPVTSAAWEPTVDTDGYRFAVTNTEVSGASVDVRASTYAFDPTTNQLIPQDARAPLAIGVDPEFQASIATRLTDRNTQSALYGIALARDYYTPPFAYPHGIEAWSYGGYAANGGFSFRNAGCGNLLLSYIATPPVLGNTLGVSVLTSDFSGILFGFPAPLVPVAGCPTCLWGTANAMVVPNPFSSFTPPIPSLVGVTFAAQGFSFSTGPCLGQIRLTGVLDITVQ